MRITGKIAAALVIVSFALLAATHAARVQMGGQADGKFIVATGQRIEPGTIALDGRPIDLALNPSGDLVGILNQGSVLLAERNGIVAGSTAKTAAGASYRGCAWSPDGKRLYVSLSSGVVQVFRLELR